VVDIDSTHEIAVFMTAALLIWWGASTIHSSYFSTFGFSRRSLDDGACFTEQIHPGGSILAVQTAIVPLSWLHRFDVFVTWFDRPALRPDT
jgi:hypothetical protein